MKTTRLSILAVAFFLTALGLVAEAKSNAKGVLSGVVNINEADVSQLTMLPSVGLKRAQAIREYALAHPFKTVEELKAIKGIGEKGFEKLKAYIIVSGPTTVKWVKAALPQ